MGYGYGVSSGVVLNDRYLLEELVDEADGVTTWRAKDSTLSRTVLVHVLNPEDARSGWALAAARKAATLTDSHVVRVLDAMEAHGQEPWTFVASESPAGRSLADIVASGPVNSEQAVLIASEIAETLIPLHASGIYHRRLDAEHVFITPNGHVKIAGLLVDQAVRPHTGEDIMTAGQQESADLFDLGRLSYFLATGSQAYRGAPEADQVNPVVDSRLSRIIAAALRPGYGGQGAMLRTAEQLVEALDTLVVSANREEVLEALLWRDDASQGDGIETSMIPTSVVTTSQHSPVMQPSAPTLQQHVVPPDGPVTQSSIPIVPGYIPEPGYPSAPVPQSDNGQNQKAAKPRAQKSQPARLAFKRRWLVLFAGLVALVLIIRGCLAPTSEPVPTPTSAPVAQAKIVSVFDFDPVADGGEEDENGELANLAIDGDPSTSWKTLIYYGNPAFGALKPGAGLVFDLGSPSEVRNFTLMLANQPNAIEMRVPADEALRSAEQAPQESVSQWSVVAANPVAGQEVVLTPESAVTTRWVLIYFTNLPPIADGQYRSGIAEAYVNR